MDLAYLGPHKARSDVVGQRIGLMNNELRYDRESWCCRNEFYGSRVFLGDFCSSSPTQDTTQAKIGPGGEDLLPAPERTRLVQTPCTAYENPINLLDSSKNR